MKRTRNGFTLVELAIVSGLGLLILLATYRIFFSQARMVANSMEFMMVNEQFRKIQMHLNNDIHEATWIHRPNPVRLEETANLVTPKPGTIVLWLIKQEVDPNLKPLEWKEPRLASDPYGQISRTREVIYELRKDPPLAGSEPGAGSPSGSTLFKLVRTENIRLRETPNSVKTQETVISDGVREFVMFRTHRKPMGAQDIQKEGDRILTPLPADIAGTGNDLVHLRVVVQRKKERHEKPDARVYEIQMETSFYKRGKEVFYHP
jgi:hypothetical protein